MVAYLVDSDDDTRLKVRVFVHENEHSLIIVICLYDVLLSMHTYVQRSCII